MVYPEGRSVGDIAVVRESLLGIGLIALTPAWGADAFQPLDIRPGLWEITLTVRSSGQPPMPPEVAANQGTGSGRAATPP